MNLLSSNRASRARIKKERIPLLCPKAAVAAPSGSGAHGYIEREKFLYSRTSELYTTRATSRDAAQRARAARWDSFSSCYGPQANLKVMGGVINLKVMGRGTSAMDGKTRWERKRRGRWAARQTPLS
uniref:Uncharacterized protein n=1 Tax=Cryptomonas curvata TaxID=233186 RepID=A0A7S0MSP3_9CRYP|mmetsp:Transcript_53380/g.111413  ORF Transcript_53380/g.111413 Transcript_53380/m.111413 type:complete len:127 (+) Transcript_53380:621-1001(+)